MVSDQVRNDVWYCLLDVARLVRYYAALSDRYKRNYKIVRVLLFAAATSGIAAFLDALPPIAQLISGGGIAVIIVWDMVSDYGRKAAILHAISLQCGDLEDDCHDLWRNIDNATITNEEAIHRSRQLDRRITNVTSGAGYADIPEDKKLNERCRDDADSVMEHKYATA